MGPMELDGASNDDTGPLTHRSRGTPRWMGASILAGQPKLPSTVQSVAADGVGSTRLMAGVHAADDAGDGPRPVSPP